MEDAISCNNVSKFYTGKVGSKITALNQLNFNVKCGEIVGLVGKNGCGKTTLLKILSGIIKPSSGNILIQGSYLSVLEVGTGFIQELNGYENINITCALFGLKPEQAKLILPEIIAFCEIENALSEPVKNYSQGMYLRLALAIVFSLKADIYFFDEVLAVGDEAFQKKCFQKFQSFIKDGKTILLVSHNFSQIAAICNRCIVLSNGVIIADGPPSKVYDDYLLSLKKQIYSDAIFKTLVEHQINILSFTCLNQNQIADSHKPFVLCIKWQKIAKDVMVCFHVDIYNETGLLILNTASLFGKKITYLQQQAVSENGFITDTCEIPAFFLNTGTYLVHLKAVTYKNIENNNLIAETINPLVINVNHKINATDNEIWLYSPAPIRTKFDWQRINE